MEKFTTHINEINSFRVAVEADKTVIRSHRSITSDVSSDGREKSQGGLEIGQFNPSGNAGKF